MVSRGAVKMKIVEIEYCRPVVPLFSETGQGLQGIQTIV
jgi:hypothetical protein